MARARPPRPRRGAPQVVGQDAALVILALALERRRARHRHEADPPAGGGERADRLGGDSDLGTGRDHDRFRRTVGCEQHVDDAETDQRRHAHGVARVVRERQERAAVRNEPAVRRNAVQHRRHAEFAHAEMQVIAARLLRVECNRVLAQCAVRGGQVRRAADQLRQQRTERVQRRLRGHAGRRRGRFGPGVRQQRIGGLRESLRQGAGQAPREFHGERRVLRLVRAPLRAPVPLRARALGAHVPGRANVLGNLERRRGPGEIRARRRDLLGADHFAVHRGGALFVRRSPADHGATADERRPVLDGDQLAEPLRPGERRRFVRYALHHAAVAAEGVGAMIDDRMTGPVELRSERAFREGHPDRVRKSLAERTGGRLDADREIALGVARGLRP